ncbi:MAG: hypothetical protein IKH52_06975 [Bacteroidaceae bacterium]|nr:hypothetical protein [Bacteroidaceae bacterium]
MIMPLFIVSTALIIVAVIIALFALLYFFKHRGHSNLASDRVRLRQVLTAIFTEVKKPNISHNRLVKELKARLHVGEKMAHILIGKAKAMGLVNTNGQTVSPGPELGL